MLGNIQQRSDRHFVFDRCARIHIHELDGGALRRQLPALQRLDGECDDGERDLHGGELSADCPIARLRHGYCDEQPRGNHVSSDLFG